MLESYQALKLDAAYRPVAIVPATDALVSYILGKTIILETHDRIINSASQSFQLPSIVVLKRKVVKHFRSFACSTKNLRIRDEGKCQYCNTFITVGRETVDHIVPKCRGGAHEWTNIVLSCVSCNQRKGWKTPEQAGMRLQSTPKHLDYSTYLKKAVAGFEEWNIYLKG
jgi:5-methylcytosine-specific restriction endonuclease McrA|tara:strand:- start:2654 stop:3160 length:507 start_codon:yes stop_codon:yes gene_type:complete